MNWFIAFDEIVHGSVLRFSKISKLASKFNK